MPKLREAFATANPDLQNMVEQVASGVRYGEDPAALASQQPDLAAALRQQLELYRSNRPFHEPPPR